MILFENKMNGFSLIQGVLLVFACICVKTCFGDRLNATAADDDNNYPCLMNSVCKNKFGGVARKSPCFSPHPTVDNITDDDFYDLLYTNCPHFFDDDGELKHPICCMPDQEESMARLIQQVDLIKRGCPSCAVNTKKYFCNLFCSPNQRQLMRVEKKLKNTNAIVNITYFIDESFAQKLFSSCRDVKLFGAPLLDQQYICGPHKRVGCDPKKFLTVIGSVDQMPMVVQPRITSKKKLVIGGNKYIPMGDEAYLCHENAPGEDKCQCDHCDQRCQEIISETENLRSKSKKQKEEEETQKQKNNSASSQAPTFFLTIVFLVVTSTSLINRS